MVRGLGRFGRAASVGLLLFLVIAAAAGPGLAKGGEVPGLPGLAGGGAAAVPVPEPPSEAELKALAALLADPKIHHWLAGQADKAAPEAKPGGSGAAAPSYGLRPMMEMVQQRIADQIHAIEVLPAEYAFARDIWEAEDTDDVLWGSVVFVVVFLAVGALFEAGFRWLTRSVGQRLLEAPRGSFGATLGRTLLRATLRILAIGFFALGSIGTFLVFHWNPILELFVLGGLTAFIAIRLVTVISALVLAPRTPALRLVPMSSGTARHLHGWIKAMAVTGTIGFLFCMILQELGFLRSAHVLLVSLIGLVLALMAIAMVWHGAGRVTAAIRRRGDPDSERFRANLADLYPLGTTLVILVCWCLWAAGASALMASLLILIGLPIVLIAANALVEAIGTVADRAPTAGAETGDDAASAGNPPALTRSPYLSVFRRAGRFAVVLIAMGLFAEAWGVNLLKLADRSTPGAALVHAAFNVILTLLLADLVWHWVNTAIERKLGEHRPALGAHGLPDEGGGAVDEGARLRTLLPLVRNFILVVLVTMTLMIVLSAIGVDIGPLLAGAGVVGLAIGFGAQALVRDIVSGVFFLVDDAFRIGEYIEIGNLRGTVEAISVRSLRLRHHRGAIHTLPFGEIRSMTNYSRDWIIMKLEFRVPFDTDLNLVKKLVKKIGQDLADHPEYGPHILETVKSQGVRRMEEFNMVVGVKFMTRPGEQWVIRREVYQRILAAFESNGIKLAARNVVVQVSGDRPELENIDAVAAAAGEAFAPTPGRRAVAG